MKIIIILCDHTFKWNRYEIQIGLLHNIDKINIRTLKAYLWRGRIHLEVPYSNFKSITIITDSCYNSFKAKVLLWKKYLLSYQ